MKVLICLSADFEIRDQRGKLVANWKTDLLEEETDDYLPPGYSPRKVLELSVIEASKLGEGNGASLMREFLASPIVKRAQLVFLDPSPNIGKNWRCGVPDDVQIERLQKFYRQFGFRNRPGANRMWLVLKGKIGENDLPT